jgi:hypothetical protein
MLQYFISVPGVFFAAIPVASGVAAIIFVRKAKRYGFIQALKILGRTF